MFKSKRSLRGSETIILLHNFHLNRGASKMCLKLGFSEAYDDNVQWEFLEAAMGVLGFPM